MKKTLIFVLISFSFFACDTTSEIKNGSSEFSLLPQPKEIQTSPKTLFLSVESELYTNNEKLRPLLELFVTEIEKVIAVKLNISSSQNTQSDIIFSIDETLEKEAYQISINEIVELKGGSYHALSLAKTTLLQLAEVENGQLKFPLVSIKDNSDANYRGLMIDLARQWHEISTIKKLIDLSAFYKMNYVQLHFTDYQSYTLPSTAFPNLPTEGKTYSVEELKDLENYSQQRGVTIIPEVDIPGHSSPFVEKYPELFAIQDTASNPWIINMGKEEVYTALNKIIGEVCEIFQSTPYFHIGGDEAIFEKVIDDPNVQEFMKKHELGDDVHELYRYFLVRMNDTVKKYDKQMCVWEGFRDTGEIEIPKDIIVFEFETNRYLPNLLVEDGYTVVNTSWKPLYVVNQKKWSPKTIYEWNTMHWENWWERAPSFTPIQVDKSDLVIGAQMCAWEQPDSAEVPSLRKRLPALAERSWNEEEKISYDVFFERMNVLDNRLSLLLNDARQDSLLVGYEFVGE